MPYPVAEIWSPEAVEDEVSGALWVEGSTGLEVLPALPGSPGVRLRAYFPGDRDPVELTARLAAALAPFAARLEGVRSEVERDWLERFRAEVQPFEIGARFLLDPREVDAVPPDAGGRLLLRLPARTAFGTGTHASTALVLRLLESLELTGETILDVGAGTGVLAFAARRLGAASAVAFDIDPAAPFAARANAALNGIDRVANFAGTFAALAPLRPFDGVCNNVVPEETRPYLVDLTRAVRPGGWGLFSGVLTEEADGWTEELRDAGWRVGATAVEAEWTALLARRAE
jgi:ribosomal protein L11 methyltransferase